MTAVYQMLPNYWYGDAIGNHAATIETLLVEWGYATDIFADVIHEKRSARPYEEYRQAADDDSWLIYHYSTGSPVNDYVLKHGANVILLYHNITPSEWFAPFDAGAAVTCDEGRGFLPQLAPVAKGAIGVSEYNAAELRAMGFANVAVAPFILDIEKKPATGASPFSDEKKVFLNVGRVAPHKGHHDLIKAFHFYKTHVDKNARLVFVGGYDRLGAYYRSLVALIDRFAIDDVIFTGPVSDEELGDYFSSAAVFVSMSHHEGFGVPPLEAMSFGTPVVALAEAATPEIVGPGGLLMNEYDPARLAELLYDVAHDETLRQTLIAAGDKRLADFSREKTTARFKEVLSSLIA